MVDPDRLSRILDRVVEDVGEIRAATATDPDFFADDLRLSGIKYKFVTAIEGCVRASHHVLSSERFGVPESNADAVKDLGKRGIVERPVADRVARAVGFRNVLVHEYADVDDQIVIANIDLLGDLETFAVQLSAWAKGLAGR